MKSKDYGLSKNKTGRGIFAAAGIFLAGILIYSNSLFNSFHFDDLTSIVQNSYIREIGNIRAIWDFWPTRFFTYLSFTFNYHLHALDVFGYHLFNLAVHLGCAFLVWQFARVTFSLAVMRNGEVGKHSDSAAFFTGLVFLAHPIQTEAVNYIVQRSALLSAFFYLLAFFPYIKLRLLQQQGGKAAAVFFYRLAFFLAAASAMLTKETAVTLPLALMLYEACFLKIKKARRENYLILLGMLFFLPAVFYLCPSVYLADACRDGGCEAGISPGHYFLTQARVMATYIRLALVPLHQNLDYDYGITRSFFDQRFLLSISLLAAVAAFAAGLCRRYKCISFGIFWFLLVLLPESSIVPRKEVIFEHRLYLAMVGYSMAVVCAVYCFFSGKTPKGAALALALLVLWYSFLTYSRNYVWKNEITLWSDVIRKSPQKARGYLNRGTAYVSRGDTEQAIADFNQIISIEAFAAEAYRSRGVAYVSRGDTEQAIADFNKAVSFKKFDAEAYKNLGNAYAGKGDFDLALSSYAEALKIRPNDPGIYFNRAVAYFLKKDYAKSWEDVGRAKELGYAADAEFLRELSAAARPGREKRE